MYPASAPPSRPVSGNRWEPSHPCPGRPREEQVLRSAAAVFNRGQRPRAALTLAFKDRNTFTAPTPAPPPGAQPLVLTNPDATFLAQQSFLTIRSQLSS